MPATPQSDMNPADRPRVHLTAQDDSPTGIGVKTGFHLDLPKNATEKLKQALSSDSLSTSIKVSPKFSFRILTETNGARLIPDLPLAAGQLYQFKLDNPDANLHETWAFQTRRDFRILSTLPADRGTGVPVNTGLEIRFSDPGFDGIDSLFFPCPATSHRRWRSGGWSLGNPQGYRCLHTGTGSGSGHDLPGHPESRHAPA